MSEEINADCREEFVTIIFQKKKVSLIVREMDGGTRDNFVTFVKEQSKNLKDEDNVTGIQPHLISLCLFDSAKGRNWTVEEVKLLSSSAMATLYKKCTVINAVQEGAKEEEKKDLKTTPMNGDG